MLTLLAMERPISFSAEDIRDEKVGRGYAGISHELIVDAFFFFFSSL